MLEEESDLRWKLVDCAEPARTPASRSTKINKNGSRLAVKFAAKTSGWSIVTGLGALFFGKMFAKTRINELITFFFRWR